MTRRGIHSKPNKGSSVDYLTPPAILEALGSFDLDPCAHANMVQPTNAWVQSYGLFADRCISLPDDGLAAPWEGRVWLNPPYGTGQHQWMKKMAEHNHGTALVASRTEVEKWFVPYVWQAATAVLFLFGRLYFWTPDGQPAKGNAGHGSVLVAYGTYDAAVLMNSGLRGQFVMLNNPKTE